MLVGSIAKGSALDLFSYHGSFTVHLARNADAVTAVDSSSEALERASENVALNGYDNVSLVQADAFEFLRDREKAGARYGTVVLDPPAFAKNKASLEGALRGYRDVNLHAMRLLETGGMLFTATTARFATRMMASVRWIERTLNPRPRAARPSDSRSRES